MRSKACMNDYDSLSRQRAKGTFNSVVPAGLQNIKQVRFEAARKRSYDRRQGVNRGLTNMMVVWLLSVMSLVRLAGNI